jgi:hypothetical protein
VAPSTDPAEGTRALGRLLGLALRGEGGGLDTLPAEEQWSFVTATTLLHPASAEVLATVVRALLQGPQVDTRRERQEVRGRVRGRVDWSATARIQAAARPDRVVCRVPVRDPDLALNRLFLGVLDRALTLLAALPADVLAGWVYDAVAEQVRPAAAIRAEIEEAAAAPGRLRAWAHVTPDLELEPAAIDAAEDLGVLAYTRVARLALALRACDPPRRDAAGAAPPSTPTLGAPSLDTWPPAPWRALVLPADPDRARRWGRVAVRLLPREKETSP